MASVKPNFSESTIVQGEKRKHGHSVEQMLAFKRERFGSNDLGSTVE